MPQRAFEPSIPSKVRIILNFVQDGGNVKGSLSVPNWRQNQLKDLDALKGHLD